MLSRSHMIREKGFTLIEVFVAMIIAMIILGVVSESYLSGLATQRLESEALRVQESGRFAMDLIARSVRRAGFRNTYSSGPTSAQEFCSKTAVPGAHIAGVDDPATLSVDIEGTATVVNVSNSSDVLTLRGYGEDNAAGTAADGSVIDCLGNSIRRGELVEETLYVAPDATNGNEPALFCRSSMATGPQPLVAGVESMQILYGEDTDSDGVINRYVPFVDLAASGGVDNVFSVMVSIVVRSANPTMRIVEPRFEYTHFSGTDQEKSVTLPSATTTSATADKRLRRQFDSTISFRNFSQC